MQDLHFAKLTDNRKALACAMLAERHVRLFSIISNKQNMQGYRNPFAAQSLYGVVAILAAIHDRGKTGLGQHIDVAMTAGLLPMLGYHFYSHQRPPTPRMFSTESPASNIVPEQSVYRTKDDRHVAISIPEPWLYERACNELGCPELIPNYMTDDPQLSYDTRKRLEEIFSQRTRDQWEVFNFERDLGISPVKNMDEVLDDPQMKHRGMIIEHVFEPVGAVKHIGTPFILSRTPADGVRDIPRYGQHTTELLTALGYSSEEIEGLEEDEVF
ncbi:MAG: CoA transferase [Novosphingobium sp.]